MGEGSRGLRPIPCGYRGTTTASVTSYFTDSCGRQDSALNGEHTVNVLEGSGAVHSLDEEAMKSDGKALFLALCDPTLSHHLPPRRMSDVMTCCPWTVLVGSLACRRIRLPSHLAVYISSVALLII